MQRCIDKCLPEQHGQALVPYVVPYVATRCTLPALPAHLHLLTLHATLPHLHLCLRQQVTEWPAVGLRVVSRGSLQHGPHGAPALLHPDDLQLIFSPRPVTDSSATAADQDGASDRDIGDVDAAAAGPADEPEEPALVDGPSPSSSFVQLASGSDCVLTVRCGTRWHNSQEHMYPPVPPACLCLNGQGLLSSRSCYSLALDAPVPSCKTGRSWRANVRCCCCRLPVPLACMQGQR